MKNKIQSKYPEHEKLALCRERSQAIGEFVDWLRDQGVIFYRYSGGSEAVQSYVIDHRLTDQLLAEFFEIDLVVLEREKQAMLRELRRAQDITLVSEQVARKKCGDTK